ncbi:MAG: metallophosphoesterase [Nanoarchaeota archaeon]|nr:metallophosphoesterase [Nanoarchaeota archaeon]
MKKGFLLDKEMLGLLSDLTEEGVANVIGVLGNLGIEERVINKRLFEKHFDKFRGLLIAEQGQDEIHNFFEGLGYKKEEEIIGGAVEEDEGVCGKVKLISAPAFPQKKIEVGDFVKHFRSRYESIKSMLENRDFENLTSIRKIGQDRGSYTIIAAVFGKRITKNKNLFLEVEDLTGNSIVLINQNKKEVFEKAKDLLNDDIVAFNVSGTSEMLFANDVIFPEASLSEKRYSDFDEYVAFAGDFHAGSTMFLEKNLLKFIKWLNGAEGDEKQRALAKKVKYLLLTGDNIDGVGHYPGQEKYLTHLTSRGQYDKVEEIIKLIRKDIKIIMCPGQHDAVWVGEPQPIIGERFAEGLHHIDNLTLVPNPALIEIDGGFRILMYHGASINRFIDEIPDIRTKFGHTSPTRVVREMLKRRHLAPIHGGMDYIPCERGDPMVIDKIPDIIATADQHRAEVSTYNNILMIASSCWQSMTPFEEKVGNVPDPCKVPLFNLKTREIKMLDFSDELKEIECAPGGHDPTGSEDGEELVCKLEGKDGSS